MLNQGQASQILAAIIATGKVYDPAACFMGLFTAIVDNGNKTTLSNLTLGTGSLATAVALGTWGSPYFLTGGNPVVDAAEVLFRPADSSEGGVFVGFYLATAATAGTLIEFIYFAQPITLVDNTSQLTVVKRLSVDTAGAWDQSEYWNG
jgi:hypothetical protein